MWGPTADIRLLLYSRPSYPRLDQSAYQLLSWGPRSAAKLAEATPTATDFIELDMTNRVLMFLAMGCQSILSHHQSSGTLFCLSTQSRGIASEGGGAGVPPALVGLFIRAQQSGRSCPSCPG